MQISTFHKELKSFIGQTGMSVNKLARGAQVPQSQVWGWAKGKGVRYTENADKVMSFIKSYRKANKKPIPKNIEDAIQDVLLANPDKEQLVCDVIKAVGRY